MTPLQILLTILIGIACGAYNGIQKSKAEGCDINALWCFRYCIGYFTVWALAIATPIAIFSYIQN